MAHEAEIAWNGRRARIVLDRAAVVAHGIEVLAAEGAGPWRVLDRSPVSVRVGRADGATARFEAFDDRIEAEIVGGRWTGRTERVVGLDAEVRDGDVAFQNRA